MAWTAPATAVAGAFTAASFNAQIRDNLLVSFPALATAETGSNGPGSHFVGTGANAIAQRRGHMVRVASAETTTSTSYAALATAGPAVTVTSGTRVLVGMSCALTNSGAGFSYTSVAVSGASTVAASNAWAIIKGGNTAANEVELTSWHLFTGLTGGSNTFTMQYQVSSGTGTFRWRNLFCLPF